MTGKTPETTDEREDTLVYSLSKLESSVQLLDYRMNKEIPADLSGRIIVLEERYNSEINALKKDFAEVKGTLKDRYTLYTIIISLIIALVTVIVTLIKKGV